MEQSIRGYVTNKSGKRNLNDTIFHSLSSQSDSKRFRKKDNLLQQATDGEYLSLKNCTEELFDAVLCHNFVWRASLSPKDAFYKKFCCACHKYDNDKDRSLWLTCGPCPASQNKSCWMSCHLECALMDEGGSTERNVPYMKLDGNFSCVKCGKVKELLRILRTQLLVAKDARRVDMLCHRISLSQKLLHGTEKYKGLQWVVDNAAKKLEDVVGELDIASKEMPRGIVNGLDCSLGIQMICASAVAAIDFMLSGVNCNHNVLKDPPVCSIQFEEVSSTSTVIILKYENDQFEDFLGCRLWHRKSSFAEYPENPTYMVLQPLKRFLLSNLDPSTEYFCKISIFSSTGEVGAWEANWITHALVEKRNNDKCPLENIPVEVERCVNTATVPPNAPSKSDGNLEIPSEVPKKRWTKKDYDNCMKVIRSLNNKGHIEKDFKMKFLSWFSRRATTQEKRVVCAFVDILIDDPPSLASQLVDTFMDLISNEKKPASQNFCYKLFH